MSKEESLRWPAYGRVALVVVCVLAAPLNAAAVEAPLITVATTAAVSGVCLLVPQLRWPVAPAVVTIATAWWGWLLLPLLAVALFSLAVDRRARAAVGCAVAALGGNLLTYRVTSLWTVQSYAFALLLPVLAIVIGLWLGNRRRLLQALTADVQHLRIEADLREEAARAAERSRIAAEMHDVLAHRLSLIALHTGVLVTKGDTLPVTIAERLGLLRGTSVEALGDLRDVLGALHDGRGAESGSGLAPVIREVRELVDEACAAGQQIEMIAEGHPSQAPTTHRLAVYRLVQEALTNARKHADGAQVAVRVDYRPPATVVEVTNTSGASRSDTVDSGYGLIGLRERVSTLGGHLDAGPAGAGTWRLAARIPHPSTGQNGTRT
nr:histidine kinase [Streptomyces sp. AC495_CC817]